MKKTLPILIFVLTFVYIFSVGAAAADFPEPTSNFFVNDFAGVIDDSDEIKIQSAAEKLYNACRAQAVVVTVSSLDGETIDDYAIGLAREWGIGDKEKSNGVLILLAVSDREVKIEVGYGLEGAIPDSKAGRILDQYGVNYFSVDDFSKGLVSVHNSVVNEIYIEYGLDPDADYTPVEEGTLKENIIFIIVVLILLILSFCGGRRGFFPIFFFGGGPRGGGFGGGPRGGFGGGSFRGGGGGFGGGGASRRF